MNIVLIAQSTKIAETLKVGLELSGEHVKLYENLQEATCDLLEARFQSSPLPYNILIADIEGNNAALIQRIRQFISAEEMPIIILKNTNTLLNLDINTLCDVKGIEKPVTTSGLLETITEPLKE
jgi:DNA-binding response OmpR family regulator